VDRRKPGHARRTLNFFGVKMINNTTGSDDILGSKMLKIHTRKIPSELLSQMGSQNSLFARNLDLLRDELHTWTFENVALIDATYKRLFPQPSDRSAEISAPLRVFAEIAGDEYLLKNLETALKVKNEAIQKPADPIETMIQAVKNLVRQGFRQIPTTHIVLEMKAMSNQNSPENYEFEPAKWENPAWVGRHLRTYNLVNINAKPRRQELFGKSLRIYPLKSKVLEEILSENSVSGGHLESQPLDFYQGCENCLYKNAGCPIMQSRLVVEKKD
jgi:hypothetical protein